ncbi:hypothetical protein CL630_02095 [bacterium]|nr:hypothetical protein [bacterium]|tara:strand:+ start:9078 stop:9515 length:438 start_codon:yes stop_codon:yes gene_type:complete
MFGFGTLISVLEFSRTDVYFRLPDVNKEDIGYGIIAKPAIRFRGKNTRFVRMVSSGNNVYEIVFIYERKNGGSVTAHKNGVELKYKGDFWRCNKCSNSPLFVKWKGGTEQSGVGVYVKCQTPMLRIKLRTFVNTIRSWFNMPLSF